MLRALVFSVLTVAGMLAAVPACSSSASSGGSAAASAHCYRASTGSGCFCFNTDQASGYAPPSYQSVTACTTSSIESAECCLDTDSSGQTESCMCYERPTACSDGDDGCKCPADQGSTAPHVSSCGPKDGQICCENDSGGCSCGREQYPGAGCVGYEGRPNGSATKVATCHAPAKLESMCSTGATTATSCDGVRWKTPPPPAPPSAGGSDGECSSSGDCIGSCSSSCYDCRAHSCVCGRKGSSGSCVY